MLSSFSKEDKIAVRSSAMAEDGQQNSFAGIFESVLNVDNDIEKVIEAIKVVFASKNTDKTLSYSKDQNHSMNIIVQKMISPKIAGVGFTEAVDINGDNVILLECVEGLADKLVSGATIPTRIKVNKNNEIEVLGEGLDLSGIPNLIKEIEKVISNFSTPMDIEWCIDENNKPYLVQARPITSRVLIRDKKDFEGMVASPGKCEGKCYLIDEDWEEEEIEQAIIGFPKGYVLVASTTDTRYLPAMKKAVGIITSEGSALSHAAIISRELL